MSRAPGRFVPIFIAGFTVAVALACSQAEPEPKSAPAPAAPPAAAAAPVVDPAAAKAEADKIFAERCTTCHGASGAGDGPASAGLVPKPRNLQDPEWQTSVTDEHIEKIVMYGGAAVGKSAMMPAQPQLKGKEDVLNGLVEIVRAFKGKPRT